MFRKELYTEIKINTSAERVWRILVDFPSYLEWNPYIRKAVGKARVGSQLKIFNQPSGTRGMTHRPTVLQVHRNHELRWITRVLSPCLFKGEHIFTIEPIGPERIRFVQREIFTGLFVPLLKHRLDIVTRRGFEEMNLALRLRAEQTCI
jgi:hypothetical protein